MFCQTTDSYKKALSYKSKQTFAQRINVFVTILFLQCFTTMMTAFDIDMHIFKDFDFILCKSVQCRKSNISSQISKYFLCIDHVCATIEDRNRLGES